jgi:hypothetical protein
MADMLVNLYTLNEEVPRLLELKQNGIEIKKALSPDKSLILDFVKKHFTQAWANECDASFSNNPVTCFIATYKSKVIGFACYEATAKNFFGPTGVDKKFEGRGVGKALLFKCLLSMKELGYAYAIIGGAEGAAGFYEKAVNAVMIKDSENGVYNRMVNR